MIHCEQVCLRKRSRAFGVIKSFRDSIIKLPALRTPWGINVTLWFILLSGLLSGPISTEDQAKCPCIYCYSCKFHPTDPSLIYRSVTKEGPWAVHLTLGSNSDVCQHLRHQCCVVLSAQSTAFVPCTGVLCIVCPPSWHYGDRTSTEVKYRSRKTKSVWFILLVILAYHYVHENHYSHTSVST